MSQSGSVEDTFINGKLLIILQSVLTSMGFMWVGIILLNHHVAFLLQKWQQNGLNHILLYMVLFNVSSANTKSK